MLGIGLVATILLMVGSLVVWITASPMTIRTTELFYSAIALQQISIATLVITLLGSLLIERTSRRANQT